MNRNDARLLVADDSPSMRNVVCELLHELGFPLIDEASDGATAWALFQRTAYDVVITDWYMPHTDGIELLKAIRHSEARSATPVVLLTGHVTKSRVLEAIEAGASAFVAKPFVSPALSDKVMRLVAELPPISAPLPTPPRLRA